MVSRQSKFQKFETDVISRDQVKGAEYNPRVISEDAKKRLRKMIARHGLVQPLVWNKRTGNLVAGHQRLAALDVLERTQNYDLQVAVVDVDDREERVLNIQLNNPSMQGDWDLNKLTALAEDAAISPEEFGFSDGDIAVLFGGDSDLDHLLDDAPEVSEVKKTLKEIKESRDSGLKKMQEEQSARFYFTVVCESEEQKKALLKFLRVPTWENFVNGRVIAEKIGV